MPYSDIPPTYVVPDDPEWRHRAHIEILPDLYDEELGGMSPWAYCDRYRPTPDLDRQAILVLDRRYPRCHACSNREASGVRNHNWCFRCPAGLMHAQLHVYDAALDRDRATMIF